MSYKRGQNGQDTKKGAEYKYVYTDPTEEGYTKTNLSKKHLKVLKNKKFYWHEKVEVYLKVGFGSDGTHFLLHITDNTLNKFLCTVLLSLAFLWNLSDIKETWKTYTDLFNQKTKGKYRADIISGENNVKALLNILEEEVQKEKPYIKIIEEDVKRGF